MISTYIVGDYTSEDNSVSVTYENAEGNVHIRQVNIPHLENGDIDLDGFNEILEGQLRGVNNKIAVGAITFVDPSEESTSPGETAATADP